MAMQSGFVIQDKVARLLSKQHGKPVLKPNKSLALKDEVANRKPKKGEASCVTEMALVMACWKQNDFNTKLCSNELTVFYRCIEKAQAEARERTKPQTLSQGGRLLPKQATKLLKRYPNL
ncbi:coiled-coil-helix-coiled-coil-helix domain-containing protein 1 [Ictalurus furcatus]|uniref:coiled-coil-helix-coiled-coil-helix domain-containing protein 1 n=1 Tax=Ictalurus furcatus TaxID=66913 RepID=UPI00234FD0B0|nr:coiled-coil-helix-coiled-coil-helix domain-containing protein 1 [Ictalurus furcatus]XP_053476119.1 coiled-coil-helix-coiled-coil-helix domain-containing protein 1 [Ictalurus furcatus]